MFLFNNIKLGGLNFCLHMSSYPFLLSMIILNVFVMFLTFLKYKLMPLYFITLFFFMFCVLFFWMVNIYIEGFLGFHNSFIRLSFKFSIFCFIFSEVMFFFGFFWAYFDNSMSPVMLLNVMNPPLGITMLNPYGLSFLNLMILMSSGFMFNLSYYYFYYNGSGIFFLFVTFFLGLMFLYFQFFEFFNFFFTITDSIFSSSFYTIVGLHGTHVILGVFFLLITIIRYFMSHYTYYHIFFFWFSLIYWHFVDVIWIFVWFFLYFMN